MMPPNLEQQIVSSLPEHQVLLSFNSDSDALCFIDWWHALGKRKFLKWVGDKPE